MSRLPGHSQEDERFDGRYGVLPERTVACAGFPNFAHIPHPVDICSAREPVVESNRCNRYLVVHPLPISRLSDGPQVASSSLPRGRNPPIGPPDLPELPPKAGIFRWTFGLPGLPIFRPSAASSASIRCGNHN